jgi:Domain of unknown function (DUF3291)
MHIAQINISRLLEPIDSPLLSDFVADLDRINDIAEKSKGFVWRLKDDNANNATSINPFDDDKILINMSVWETIDDLKNFAYRSDHVEVFIKRTKWFERMTVASMALWYVEKGYIPTPEEGRDRLLHLRLNGETAHSFSFKIAF